MNKPNWKIKRSDTMTEKDLQKQCEYYLNILKNQGRVWYWHDKSMDHDSIEKKHRSAGGFPDLIVWIRFNAKTPEIHTMTFELKTPKGSGTLTGGQQAFVHFVEGAENDHYILNDFDEFRTIMDKALGV